MSWSNPWTTVVVVLAAIAAIAAAMYARSWLRPDRLREDPTRFFFGPAWQGMAAGVVALFIGLYGLVADRSSGLPLFLLFSVYAITAAWFIRRRRGNWTS